MSDPIGTSGLGGGSHIGADLAAVMQGGPTFVERMEQLSERTAAHEKALGELTLGRAARDAYLHAHQLKADAEKTHAVAAKAINDANSQSTATLNEANATAARIVAKAKQEAEKIKAEAEQIRLNAEAQSERMRGEARQDRDEAQALRDTAATDRATAAQTLSASNIEKAQLEADRQSVNRRRDRLFAARDRLVSAIKEADGHVLGV
jgi:cell division septum initiation protein DivIVA